MGAVTTTFTLDRAEGMPLMVQAGSVCYITRRGGLPVEHVDEGNTPLYYQQDQPGSSRALMDSTGNLVATFTYTPYGRRTGKTGKVRKGERETTCEGGGCAALNRERNFSVPSESGDILRKSKNELGNEASMVLWTAFQWFGAERRGTRDELRWQWVLKQLAPIALQLCDTEDYALLGEFFDKIVEVRLQISDWIDDALDEESSDSDESPKL